MKDEKISEKKISIYKATLNEIESLANINRNIAKEIIKLRVAKENITKTDLLEIKGIGDKTATLIEEIFDL